MKNRYILYLMICGYLICSFFSSVVYGDDSKISIDPHQIYANETFDVNINLSPKAPVRAWECKIRFDPMYLEALKVTCGDFFQDRPVFFSPGEINNVNGTVTKLFCVILGNESEQQSIMEDGVLATIRFSAKNKTGITAIIIEDYGITDNSGYLPLNATNNSVIVEIINKHVEEPPVEEPPKKDVPIQKGNISNGIQLMDIVIPVCICLCVFLIAFTRIFLW